MAERTLQLASEAETQQLGIHLASLLSPGAIISVNGPLGAGKTRLVQALATGLGISADTVTSPTFVLIHEYKSGRVPLYHFDAYRVADDDEFGELGPEDYFFGDGITIVEWGDRVANFFPPEAIRIAISPIGSEQREVTVYGSEEFVAKLRAADANG